MNLGDEIRNFIDDYDACGVALSDDDDVLAKASIDGDDAFEFMEAFAKRFGVEMSAYRWYFHHGEEGANFGAVLFAPPNKRVEHIPITIRTLVQATESRTWPIVYPAHKLPAHRWDTRINLGCFVLALVALLIWLVTRLL